MKTYKLAIIGIAIALNVVLTRFMSIAVPMFGFSAIRIGLGLIIITVVSIWLDPFSAAAVAAISDLIGALVFPIAVYFPGFTVTSFFLGLICGYTFRLFNKNQHEVTFLACMVSVTTSVLFVTVVNTFWVEFMFHTPFKVLIVPRLISAAIKIICFPPIVFLLCKTLKKINLK